MRCSVPVVALLCGMLLAGAARPASAIELEFNYFNTGLEPSFDPDGSLLLGLFEYAEAFYEDVYPGSTFTSTIGVTYAELDLLNALGLYTPGENVIRIDPSVNRTWWIDPTPGDNSEFEMSQLLWLDDLTSTQRSEWYDDFSSVGAIPETFETAFRGESVDEAVFDEDLHYDLLSTVLHEVGHALGLAVNLPETADGDFDFLSEWVAGQNLSAVIGSVELVGNVNVAHLENENAMMFHGGNLGRVLPSHTDLMAMGASLGLTDLDLPRREFYLDGNWNDDKNWSGDAQPGSDDEAFVRLGTATVTGAAFARNLNVSRDGRLVIAAGGKLDLDNLSEAGDETVGDVALADEDAMIIIHAGGELEARDVDIGSDTVVELRGGLLDARSVLNRARIDTLGPNPSRIEADTFENSGTMLVDGGDLTIDIDTFFENRSLIRVLNGSTLTLESTSAAPWKLDRDSSSGFVTVDVDGGHLAVASGGLSDDFNSVLRIANGGSVDMAEPWQIADATRPSGGIRFEGTGGTLSGARLTLRGELEVASGTAVIDAPITTSSGFEAPGLVVVRSGAELQQNGVFVQSSGELSIEAGATATFNNSVEFTTAGGGVIDGDAIFNGSLRVFSDDYTGAGRHVHNGDSWLRSGADITIGAVEVGDAGSLRIDAANLTSDELEVRGAAILVRGGDWTNSGVARVSRDSGLATATVNSSSSAWNIGGDLVIGAATGAGRVELDEGVIDVQGKTSLAAGSSLAIIEGEFTAESLTAASASTIEMSAGEATVGGFLKQSGTTFNLSGGTFTIDGGPGVFNSSFAFGAGPADQPTFRVVNGADVSVTANWHIGSAAGTHATTIVSGPGSVLRSIGTGPGDDLYVGRFGAGTLIIENGGLADFGDDFELARDGADSTGTATIRGVANVFGDKTRSEVRVTRNGTGAAINVGRLGAAVLNIEDGAIVQGAGSVAVGTGATASGELNVGGFTDGFSAELLVPNSLVNVGRDGDTGPTSGTINVTTGGIVTSGTMSVRTAGRLAIDGGRVITENFTLASGGELAFDRGELNVHTGDSDFGPSTLRLGNAGLGFPLLSVSDGADAVTRGLLIGDAAGEDAIVTVMGVSADGARRSTLRSGASGNDLRVGQSGTGTLLIGGGGLVSYSDDVEIARETVDSVGLVTLNGVANAGGTLIRSELVAGDTLLVGRAGAAQLNIEEGALVTSLGNVSVGTAADSTGQVTIVGASNGLPAELNADGATVFVGASTGAGNNAMLSVFNLGLLVADELEVRQRGIGNLAGGEMRLDLLDLSNAQAFNMSAGRLDTLAVNGRLAPRGGVVAPRGVMVINGFYEPVDDAALEIELTSASSADLLAIDGFATLGGELLVLLGDSYTPALGDEFGLIIAGGITGEFDLLTLPPLDSGLAWDVAYSPNEVTLEVVTQVLAGDYNNDGVVDLADFTVWRDNLDAPAGTLVNDTDGGQIGVAQYQTWRANFGDSLSPTPITANQSVPEPLSGLLLACLAIAASAPRPRQKNR